MAFEALGLLPIERRRPRSTAGALRWEACLARSLLEFPLIALRLPPSLALLFVSFAPSWWSCDRDLPPGGADVAGMV